jgi:hypothetical protein
MRADTRVKAAIEVDLAQLYSEPLEFDRGARR